MKKIILWAAVFALSACSNPANPSSGTPAITSIEDLEESLKSQSGGTTAEDPVSVRVAINLGTDWQNLLATLNRTGKYVDLDLSGSTMAGTDMTGTEFNPDPSITAGKDRIVSLVLPASITGIAGIDLDTYNDGDPFPFNGFNNLKTIKGENVTVIGDAAFYKCTGLTGISLPAAATIGYYAFAGCTGLTDVTLPAATTIGDYAFSGCTGLTGVTLPAATTIGAVAFEGCTGLTGVSLPAAATIGDYAFKGCTGLTGVSLPAAATIGDYAFYACTGLTDVTLPAAVTIGTVAFYGCTGLTDVTLGASAPTVGTWMFVEINSPQTVTVKVPQDATGYDATWEDAFRGKGSDGSGTVNSNITVKIETIQ